VKEPGQPKKITGYPECPDRGSKAKELKQLEIISGMSIEQAKEHVITKHRIGMKGEASRRLHEWEIKIKAEAESPFPGNSGANYPAQRIRNRFRNYSHQCAYPQ